MRRSVVALSLVLLLSMPFRAWPAPDFLLLLPADVPFPEGVAADRDGTLYVGSLTLGSIARFLPGEEQADILVPEGVLEHGAIGLRIDGRRKLLWACDGSPFLPVSSALVGISLDNGTLAVRHALPSDGGAVFCNDMAVSPRGDVFISDSFGGRVLRVSSEDALAGTDAELWRSDVLLSAPDDPPFGANGIVATRRAIFVVNFNTGALIRIPHRRDGSAGTPATVRLLDRDGHAVRLNGPDGLVRSGLNQMLVVENGVFGGGSRLTQITFRVRAGKRVGELETIVAGLDTPTTVAIDGGIAWVVESQLDHLFGIDPDPVVLPFRLVGVEFR